MLLENGTLDPSIDREILDSVKGNAKLHFSADETN